ncbi:MAG: hypothetical protein QM655_00355 [Nocardioidaceae bacterium]
MTSDRQPLFLHVGLPKTGTTYLQTVLAENRAVLRQHGFVYPFVRPEGMFHAAVELRGDAERWGLDPGLIEATWAALLDRARDVGGTAIISHEILGAATSAQVDAALAEATDFDVHLVVTARDLARQVPAHWQEGVKNGQSYSYAQFREQLLAPGLTGRDDEFWCEQDLVDTLDRWSRGLSADHVHIVVCPPSGASPELLWRRFATAVGLVGVPVDLTKAYRVNPSLGRTQIAVLRSVNQVLGGRIGWPAYAHVVKRRFAQKVLVNEVEPDDRALATPDLLDLLKQRTEEWVATIGERGYRVYGDLADLAPRAFGPQGYDPDAVDQRKVTRRVEQAVPRLLAEAAARRGPGKRSWVQRLTGRT